MEVALISGFTINKVPEKATWVNVSDLSVLEGKYSTTVYINSSYVPEGARHDDLFYESSIITDEDHSKALTMALATKPKKLVLVYSFYPIPPSWRNWLSDNYPEVIL